jgi:RNA polymerase sigma-70 factor (ECF subfamily)
MQLTDFDSLYRQHARQVFTYALSLSGDRTVADDITAETFVRLWGARERVDLTTVVGYLLTIARHLYLEGLRQAKRRGELPAEVQDGAPSHHQVTEDRAELALVLADLQSLPEPDRSAVLMRAHEELSYEHIGRALGTSAGAAKVRVHRARQRLAARRLARRSKMPCT